MIAGWRFAYRPSPTLPALAWIATIHGRRVAVRCGLSVRREARGFVEGTWVGAPEVSTLHASTAVFGSGVVADGEDLVIVPPSHPLERLYTAGRGGARIVSNSLVALLEEAGLELDRGTLYPPVFAPAAEGIGGAREIPTTTEPVRTIVYHNLRLTGSGDVAVEERPREQPFSSFDDYRHRLALALGSAVDNAPAYEMAVSISSGYDSTAVACVAATIGCRRALTFATGKPVHSSASLIDSGEPAARHLGMTVESFDRLAYLDRDDLPEAEFLATGMSGEDVVMVTMESAAGRALLLTGSEAYRLKGNPYRPGLYRGDLSACSLTEFRLRTDFVHLPLLFFGASEQPSLIRIIESDEMRPYSVPGRYDKPIQRRICEEAGLARGTFATVKRRASARIHTDGIAALAPATVAALREYADAEGTSLAARPRFVVGRRHRLLLRIARVLRLERLAAPLAGRRRALIHAEPVLGSLLFRWAVSVVRPRYRDTTPPKDI